MIPEERAMISSKALPERIPEIQRLLSSISLSEIEAKFAVIGRQESSRIRQKMTYRRPSNKQWKNAMIEFIESQHYTHCLTLHWHSDIGYDAAYRHLRLLHAMVDAKVVGKDYSTVSPKLRSQAIFAYEGSPGINLHVHSAWRFSHPSKFEIFENLFRGKRGPTWSKLAKSGTHELDPNPRPGAAVNYLLKKQHMRSENIEIIWSDDFLASK